MAQIAPWLKAPDVAEDFARGAQIGGQLAAERQRLQQEQARTDMEAQARADALKRQTLIENTRLQTEKAYRQATLGLAQARLDEASKVNAAKLKEAAQKAMAHQRLSGLLESGVPLEKALLQVPELATPQALVDAHKMALDLGTQRLEQRKIEDAERQASLDARTQRPVEVGEDVTTSTDADHPNVTTTKRTKRFGIPAGQAGQVVTHRFDPEKGLIPVGGE